LVEWNQFAGGVVLIGALINVPIVRAEAVIDPDEVVLGA